MERSSKCQSSFFACVV